MKHKSLVETFKEASKKADELVPSGATVNRLSETTKSLNRLNEWKRKQQQATALAALKIRKKPADNLIPPEAKYNPTRFADALNKIFLYWGEFNQRFGSVSGPYRFSREDFKRYWLLYLGATPEELSELTGKKVDAINKWIKLIQEKILHNEWPARWIEKQTTKEITFSGTASPTILGTATAEAYRNRLRELRDAKRLEKLQQQANQIIPEETSKPLPWKQSVECPICGYAKTCVLCNKDKK